MLNYIYINGRITERICSLANELRIGHPPEVPGYTDFGYIHLDGPRIAIHPTSLAQGDFANAASYCEWASVTPEEFELLLTALQIREETRREQETATALPETEVPRTGSRAGEDSVSDVRGRVSPGEVFIGNDAEQQTSVQVLQEQVRNRTFRVTSDTAAQYYIWDTSTDTAGFASVNVRAEDPFADPDPFGEASMEPF